MPSSHSWKNHASNQPETLISQPQLRHMHGGKSDMTIWRWRKSGLLPEPIVINRRNYWRASDIAAMQKRMADQSASAQGAA